MKKMIGYGGVGGFGMIFLSALLWFWLKGAAGQTLFLNAFGIASLGMIFILAGFYFHKKSR